jgi:hypothetical protein
MFGTGCGLDVLWMVYMSTLNSDEGSRSTSRHAMNMKDDSDVRMLIVILSRVLTPCEIPLLVHESLPVVPVILLPANPVLILSSFPTNMESDSQKKRR